MAKRRRYPAWEVTWETKVWGYTRTRWRKDREVYVDKWEAEEMVHECRSDGPEYCRKIVLRPLDYADEETP